MLTDGQIEEMASRMGIPLVFCGFKSELPNKLHTNKSYIINLENDINLDGGNNQGSHWTCFQVVEYPNHKREAIYFDSYGSPPPEIVKKRIASNFGIKYVPYNKKDIQSLMNDACGWYCLAFLHFINASPYRSRSLYDDTATFLEMFDDLNKVVDFKRNEWTLKHFFLPKDGERKKVEVLDVANPASITTDISDDGENGWRIPVEIKYV